MGTGKSHTGTSWRGRLCAQLALFLFILRAAIPVGFMPDIGALANGAVEIVICTPEGLQTLRVDQDGQPLPDDGKQPASSDECPYHAVVSKLFAVPDTPVLPGRPFLEVTKPAPARITLRSVRAAGPPLGQRAPPYLLG